MPDALLISQVLSSRTQNKNLIARLHDGVADNVTLRALGPVAWKP
jgi:hypothetical protein